MPSVIARRALAAVVVLALSAGVAACSRTAPEPKAPTPTSTLFGFSSEEQRIVACLDLQDHIVDLSTDEYVSREGVRLTRHQRAAFRDGWAEQLAKGGTFEPFERSCFANLTPLRFDCGMSSRTTDDVDACMRLGQQPERDYRQGDGDDRQGARSARR
jgi:hypothetical protein